MQLGFMVLPQMQIDECFYQNDQFYDFYLLFNYVYCNNIRPNHILVIGHLQRYFEITSTGSAVL